MKILISLVLMWALDTHASDLLVELETALSVDNTLFAVALTLLAGFLTSLSPCVYPLIPITLTVMGARSYQSHVHGFLVSLSYVLGMTLVYSVLGGIFAYVGLLMGALMQHPFILVAIAGGFLLMGLSMLGLFQIWVPASWTNALARVGGRGMKGAFFMGLVAGVLAAPCTGPVLAFILTLIATQKDLVLGMTLMLAFSVGLGFPFLLLGTFSSAIAHLPKSGPFMTITKSFFGIAMIVTALYYGYLALPSSAPTEHLSPNFVVINDTTKDIALFDRLLADAKKDQRPVMVDFFAEWCAACLDLEKNTFVDKSVAAMLTNFLVIKVDSTRSSEHLADLQNRYQVVGLPTIVFINQHGVLMPEARVLGYLPPEKFLARLKKVGITP